MCCNGSRRPPRTIPDLYKDPDGYWIASNLYINTPGYNTALVPKGTRAEDLSGSARSEMARQDGLERAAVDLGGVGFVGTVLAEMGEEKGMAYLRALRQAEGRQCGGRGARRCSIR